MCPYLTFFGIKLSSYGIFMLLGILTVSLLSIRRAKKHNIKFEDVIIVTAFIIGFFIFGAWLLYITVTYSFKELLEMLYERDFSFLNNGGLVFYGGLLSGIIGAFLGLKFTKIEHLYAEDIFVPYVPLGHAIGRIGCFFAGCCRGMKYEGIFSVRYNYDLFGNVSNEEYFPTQLLEATMNVFIFLTLLIYRRRKRKVYDLLFLYIFEYAVFRFFIEYFRGDFVRGIYFNISTSQWISILLVVICFVYNFVGINLKKHCLKFRRFK